jgi:hypothetical protein
MATEHVLREVLRRAAPFALRSIDAELERLKRQVERTSEARYRLDGGASRARITSANARHIRACEARDRLLRLREEIKGVLRG